MRSPSCGVLLGLTLLAAQAAAAQNDECTLLSTRPAVLTAIGANSIHSNLSNTVIRPAFDEEVAVVTGPTLRAIGEIPTRKAGTSLRLEYDRSALPLHIDRVHVRDQTAVIQDLRDDWVSA